VVDIKQSVYIIILYFAFMRHEKTMKDIVKQLAEKQRKKLKNTHYS